MTGTEARHRDAAAVASRIVAVGKINSAATMMGMDTAARWMGGVDLAAVSMPIVAACCWRAVDENTIKENRERQVTCFFASNIRAGTVNSYRRIEYKSYVIFQFYVDSTARRHAVLIPLTTQDGNQSPSTALGLGAVPHGSLPGG